MNNNYIYVILSKDTIEVAFDNIDKVKDFIEKNIGEYKNNNNTSMEEIYSIGIYNKEDGKYIKNIYYNVKYNIEIEEEED